MSYDIFEKLSTSSFVKDEAQGVFTLYKLIPLVAKWYALSTQWKILDVSKIALTVLQWSQIITANASVMCTVLDIPHMLYTY